MSLVINQLSDFFRQTSDTVAKQRVTYDVTSVAKAEVATVVESVGKAFASSVHIEARVKLKSLKFRIVMFLIKFPV